MTDRQRDVIEIISRTLCIGHGMHFYTLGEVMEDGIPFFYTCDGVEFNEQGLVVFDVLFPYDTDSVEVGLLLQELIREK